VPTGKLFRAGALGGLIVAATMALALRIQSARDGWPFSEHHLKSPSGDAHSGGIKMSPPAKPPGAALRTVVTLDPKKADEFGVRVEPVRRELAARTLRAVAVIVPDEGRVSEIHTRVAGWIEQLYVNKTGQTVRAGQALLAIFSPDLLAAQNELVALKKATATGSSGSMLAGARSKLGVLGMSRAQIEALESSAQPRRLVTVSSPRRGVVIQRNVAVGTAVDPSTQLMMIADLSRLWALAELPERDVPDVPIGSEARLDFPASGKSETESKVTFIYPTLTERTRTLRARFELDNPSGTLRPGMYGTATFQTSTREALTVARDAVVDTGLEQHVFVVEHPGHYVPRRVEVGALLGDRIEIRSGLKEGDSVVASGVFLIDSESRLRASGGGEMAGMKMDGPHPATAPAQSSHSGHGG
jgi:Cu(I)/Ag(I) efflux system membrane fusion protein